MLQFLESGRALYVLTGICLLGILTRLVARHHYKRLLRESANPSLTKHRMLKELLQRAESTYRMNQGLTASGVWLEHQLNELRVMGLSLPAWNGLGFKWTWLCLLAGGAGAFFAYWYRLDTSYIVLYGGGAILFAMLTMFFDGGSGDILQEQLLAALQDHLDNVLFPRLSRAALPEEGHTANRKVSRMPVRSLRFSRGGKEEAAETQEGVDARPAARTGRRRGADRSLRTDSENGVQEAAAGTEAKLETPAGETDVDELKRSLEQIAAGREHPRAASGGNWLKDLGPEEVELIGDILRQYLA
ncbi:MAG: hypothetical protein LUE86_11315 [Clostridiales bacterium]|nr:hypothetical protein [Clostridiales bacterium]